MTRSSDSPLFSRKNGKVQSLTPLVPLDGGSTIAGKLELLRAPAYPWDAHQPLRLAIAGLIFSSREIERWTKI